MRRLLIPAALAVAIALVPASATSASTKKKVAREVAHINRAYHQRVADGDAGAVARLYARNAKFIVPDSPPASGRKAIRRHLNVLIERGLCGFRIHQRRLTISGREATGYGTYTAKVCFNGGTSQKGHGYYVLTYQRQGNGSLKILYDIFNAVN